MEPEYNGATYITDEELQALFAATTEHGLAPSIVQTLWTVFSQVQMATWIKVDEESLARFKEWLKTGKRESAWS